ncbi:iron-sulfur cluster assembly accessory protein [Methylocapsa polymorpha]|uniref:Iron-sulfur cluster assembly accessory protein n=1 Tax=Methylocapsa polymorpha TaxID=3080828 RepID=A0ABZ0HUP6_9HYPH|nr:iron-sulfur cluster assembly accessory protein [Methylocapsa sp. RX1]
MQDLNVTLTPAADKFIRRMLRFDGGPGSGLRLIVSPGGCSGLSAEFSVEAQPGAGETVHEHNGLKFFLLAQSRLLLQGVTMDFVETPTSAGLKFHDPKNVSTCGSHSAPVVEHEHAHEH